MRAVFIESFVGFSVVSVPLENISLTWGRRRLIVEIRSITIKHKETLTLSVKGCNLYTYSRQILSLGTEGSLSYHTCCDTGPGVLRSHPKECPYLDKQGVLMT